MSETIEYYAYVSAKKHRGERERKYGPFSDPLKAHAYGVPFAEEGFDVEIGVETGSEICDFCVFPGSVPTWAYPCEDFLEVGSNWASRGSWAACEICHDLIESNDYEMLAIRSTESWMQKHGHAVPPQNYKEISGAIKQQLGRLHRKFHEHRQGEPVRVYQPGRYGMGVRP